MKRVAIICGGRSSEHEISCLSAAGVYKAIDRALFEPIIIGITKSGDWVLIPDSFTFEAHGDVLPSVPENAPRITADVHGFTAAGKNLAIDVLFPVLHGPYGEDGSVQGFFEIADLPFVGSGVLASAVAMDKSFAKPIFSAHGIETAPGFVLRRGDWPAKKFDVLSQADALGYPLFIKPARGGSSRGTHKVKGPEDFGAAIEDAFTFDQKVMVEKAIDGAEIECAVLEIDGVPRASLVGKVVIDPRFEFYDFEAKYLNSATRVEVPAPLPEGVKQMVQESAVKAFVSLGCSGLARVDFFVTENGHVIINELNTMPGFTASSVYPKLWAASGIDYQEVITHLITTAFRRTNGVLGN